MNKVKFHCGCKKKEFNNRVQSFRNTRYITCVILNVFIHYWLSNVTIVIFTQVINTQLRLSMYLPTCLSVLFFLSGIYIQSHVIGKIFVSCTNFSKNRNKTDLFVNNNTTRDFVFFIYKFFFLVKLQNRLNNLLLLLVFPYLVRKKNLFYLYLTVVTLFHNAEVSLVGSKVLLNDN